MHRIMEQNDKIMAKMKNRLPFGSMFLFNANTVNSTLLFIKFVKS